MEFNGLLILELSARNRFRKNLAIMETVNLLD